MRTKGSIKPFYNSSKNILETRNTKQEKFPRYPKCHFFICTRGDTNLNIDQELAGIKVAFYYLLMSLHEFQPQDTTKSPIVNIYKSSW